MPSGDPTTADEHRQFFDTFVDIFDALVEIFERQEMTAQDYFGLLASAFSQMTLAFIPPKLDQVLVGSIERSRHPNLKAIFLLGATQKQFPDPAGQFRRADRRGPRCRRGRRVPDCPVLDAVADRPPVPGLHRLHAAVEVHVHQLPVRR